MLVCFFSPFAGDLNSFLSCVYDFRIGDLKSSWFKKKKKKKFHLWKLVSIFWRHIFAVLVFVKLIWNTRGWSATQPRGLNGTQSIHVFFQSSFWFLCFTLNTRYIYCPFAGEVKSLCWKKNSLGVTHENFFFPMCFQKWKNMEEHFFSPPLKSKTLQ